MIKRVLIIAAVAGLAGCARPSSRSHRSQPAATPDQPAPPSCNCAKPTHAPTVSDESPRWG
jgi:uncharacterized lipoprotein YajG